MSLAQFLSYAVGGCALIEENPHSRRATGMELLLFDRDDGPVPPG